VTNGKKVREVVKDIVNKHGGIDILVNCAGVISSHPLLELKESEWDRIMNVNLKGMFLITQSVLPEMIKKKQGKIVNIGSDLSSNGQRMLAHYCASKHGVLGFTRSVALEVAEHGILVNAVCPGPIETKLHYQDVDRQVSYTGVSTKAHLKKEIDSIPLKKLGRPSEVARVVLFLVSEENTHITGEAVNVCGGLVMH
jgi:3-oxoacyl-[acyl-carrier protein] reductase